MNLESSNIYQMQFQDFNQVAEKLSVPIEVQKQNQAVDLKEIRTLMALVFSCLNSTNKIFNHHKQEEVFSYKELQEQKIIKNFYQIDKGYYRGAAPDIKGLEYLIENKRVKTIIDLRYLLKKDREKRKYFVAEFGLKYINIPMNPLFPPTTKQIKQFLEAIDNINNQPVYVHCREGKDRTGIMTAVYRVINYNYDYDTAFAEMLKFGHHVNLLPLLKIWLYKYINDKKEQIVQKQRFADATGW